jgi:hypothetical protein
LEQQFDPVMMQIAASSKSATIDVSWRNDAERVTAAPLAVVHIGRDFRGSRL